MNALDQLNSYLRSIESRLRLFAVSRGAAIITVAALVTTVLLVFIINQYAFSERSLLIARGVLFLSLAVALSFGLVIPLFRLSRRHAAKRAEAQFPEFKERLLTLAEAPDASNPFVHLIADDALTVARANTAKQLISGRAIWGLVSSAGLAIFVLAWLFLAGPGYLGYGTALLWAGPPKLGTQAFYDITVAPGDKTVRRKADQLITAQLVGFQTDKVRLYARYGGASKWEQVFMQPQPHGPGFEFLFGGLPENVEYYVEAGAVHSKHYTLRVVDLPGIKKIRVTYNYPSWSGLKPETEDPGGDLRAVQGTEAEVAIETDRPLGKGLLMLNDDSQIDLKSGEGNWLTARVPIEKDGMYHIAALDRGENVRLSEDYFIEAKKDTPPTLKLVRPARDSKVNPIEEVPVEVQASDDFGLHEVSLRYSVNGGPEKSVSMLSQNGARDSRGKYTIALEDYKLSPGDVISLYATARDARNTVKTDMYFIQAEPFERNYSQSQQAGGGAGGGGDDDQNQISERQKEIIAATWNEIKEGAKDAGTARDDSKFLSQLQGKLAEQSRSLAERMRARQLTGASSEFQSFAKDMEAAATEMGNAVEKIKGMKWNDAIAPEQKALQNLLRAEATFRDIQVAFGQQQGGGGGGGGMGRDLENLFDLELDTEKNQYETGQQSASAGQREKEIDEALQKLKELAKRQQELAEQQQKQQQAFRQRWEQEMLRREAEDLQRKMEQLQRGDSSQQQQQSSNSQSQQSSNSQGQQSSSSQGQQSSSQSSSSQQSGRQSQQQQQQSRNQQQFGGSASEQRLQQAIDRLKQATDDMRRAESAQNNSPEQGSASQRRAADRLQESSDLLNGMRREQAAGQIGDLARRSQQLSEHQKEYHDRLRAKVGQPGQNQQDVNSMASEKDQMAKDLKKLEEDMQSAARSMAGTQPSTSSKLRDALSQAQQDELDLRMRKGAEWMRQGYGMQAWMSESYLMQGLDRLQQQVKEAQASLRPEDKNGKPGAGDGKDKLESALAQVEKTRERMQQMADAQRGQQGQRGQNQGQQGQQGAQQRGGQQQGGQQQGGQQQAGQQQQGQQQQGQQQGGQQQGGQQQGGQQQGGQQQGDVSAQNGGNQGGGPISDRQYGTNLGQGGSYRAGYLPEPTMREAQRDLSQLRQDLQGNADMEGQLQQLLGQMQRLNNYQNDPLLADRINREILPQLERLELELRHELGQPSQVRNPGTDRVPSGYADSVAEYYRRLSKGK
ncbi:MAG TPA: hypothetical protein VKU01_16165 [Bryobacteraceae bacterium]|nr:hypothetical protein [Bryobacteraceae bacterium]